MYKFIAFTAFLIISCLIIPVYGLMIPITIENLTINSDSIIIGKVTEIESKWDETETNVYTISSLTVDRVLKGNISSNSTIFILSRGGIINDLQCLVEDEPIFTKGQLYGIFLTPVINDTFRVYGKYQGLIPLSTDTNTIKFKQQISTYSPTDFEDFTYRILNGDYAEKMVPFNEKIFVYQSGEFSSYSNPVITSITPNIAPAGTESVIVISGSGFGNKVSRRSDADVCFFFQGTNEDNYYSCYASGWYPGSGWETDNENCIISWTNNQIITKIPIGYIYSGTALYPGSASSGPVFVMTDDGKLSNKVTFTVTYSYGKAKWPGISPIVNYYIHAPSQSYYDAVNRAAQTWNSVNNKNFKFNYAGSYPGGTFPYDYKRNNKNEIFWAADFTGDTSYAAAQTWASNGIYGEIYEVDIWFNDHYQYDVESVALHELGHALKLKDLYGNLAGYPLDTHKIMYGFWDTSRIQRTLSNEDIAGIQYIYPGTNTPTTTPTPTPTTTPVTSTHYEFLKQWGTSGTSPGQFNKPWEVAIHSIKDRVYVTDTWNHRIQVFTKNGGFLTSWGSLGSGNGQFNFPIGVAINENLGRVYVSEENGNRIQTFTEDGVYLFKWGSYGSGQGQFKDMREISVDKATGNVYVADTGNNRIQVFTADGVFLRQIGTPGSGNGQLLAPFDVFIAQNTRKVYVTDQTNQRVQIFNENGGYLSQFGTGGTGNGQFTGPTGITVNNTGYAFVVDQGNNRIQVFSPTGSYITGWGGYGTGPGQFNAPWGIGLDPANGYVYIGDSHNNRIQVFKPKYIVTPTSTPTPITTTLTPTPTQTSITPTPTHTSSPIQVDFTASTTSGIAPLTVRFQDTSQGNPTSWMWDINGDGFKDYSDKTFEHTYTSPGIYSVTLSISSGQELFTNTKTNYIHVISTTPTTPSTSDFNINLHPGWNFIATPKTLAEGHRTAGEVFNAVNTDGHSIYSYNTNTQSWNRLNPQDEVEPLQGIWLYSATSTQVPLIFDHNPAISWTRSLSPGWNAIGFTYPDSVSAKDALLPVQYAWTQMIGYNAESQLYDTSIINGGSGTHSDTNLIHLGKGYWIFMNSQGTLT